MGELTARLRNMYPYPDARYAGRELCLASNQDRLVVVDVTDKAAPRALSAATYPGWGYTHQGWLTEDHRYFLMDDEGDEGRNKHNTRTYLWDVRDLTDPRDILISPVVSEKSYGLLDEGKYTFVVDPRANKTEIKIAVEKVFGVKVLSVNTLNRPGKRKRTRSGYGKRKDTKRAIVTLSEESRAIDVFGGRAS